MPSTKQDITIYQGEDRQIDFTVQGSSFDASTANEIDWAMFDKGGTPVSKSKTGGNISAPDADSAIVSLAPADTSSVEPGKYTHELKVTNASGNKAVAAYGTVTVRQSVS